VADNDTNLAEVSELDSNIGGRRAAGKYEPRQASLTLDDQPQPTPQELPPTLPQFNGLEYRAPRGWRKFLPWRAGPEWGLKKAIANYNAIQDVCQGARNSYKDSLAEFVREKDPTVKEARWQDTMRAKGTYDMNRLALEDAFDAAAKKFDKLHPTRGDNADSQADPLRKSFNTVESQFAASPLETRSVATRRHTAMILPPKSAIQGALGPAREPAAVENGTLRHTPTSPLAGRSGRLSTGSVGTDASREPGASSKFASRSASPDDLSSDFASRSATPSEASDYSASGPATPDETDDFGSHLVAPYSATSRGQASLTPERAHLKSRFSDSSVDSSVTQDRHTSLLSIDSVVADVGYETPAQDSWVKNKRQEALDKIEGGVRVKSPDSAATVVQPSPSDGPRTNDELGHSLPLPQKRAPSLGDAGPKKGAGLQADAGPQTRRRSPSPPSTREGVASLTERQHRDRHRRTFETAPAQSSVRRSL